jgi:hypothetical protein
MVADVIHAAKNTVAMLLESTDSMLPTLFSRYKRGPGLDDMWNNDTIVPTKPAIM